MCLSHVPDEDEIHGVVDRDIELRNYQRELARDGCEGENIIVMAPTNSGKTRVACAIMQVCGQAAGHYA